MAVAHQAPLSMELSRQEYGSGLLCPPRTGSSWRRDWTQVSDISCTSKGALHHKHHLGSLAWALCAAPPWSGAVLSQGVRTSSDSSETLSRSPEFSLCKSPLWYFTRQLQPPSPSQALTASSQLRETSRLRRGNSSLCRSLEIQPRQQDAALLRFTSLVTQGLLSVRPVDSVCEPLFLIFFSGFWVLFHRNIT